ALGAGKDRALRKADEKPVLHHARNHRQRGRQSGRLLDGPESAVEDGVAAIGHERRASGEPQPNLAAASALTGGLGDMTAGRLEAERNDLDRQGKSPEPGDQL